MSNLLQAAFLEGGVVDQLASLLQSLVHNNDDTLEVTALCTMALEVVTVLFNPDVCLDPMSPTPQRVQDECPSLNEVSKTLQDFADLQVAGLQDPASPQSTSQNI